MSSHIHLGGNGTCLDYFQNSDVRDNIGKGFCCFALALFPGAGHRERAEASAGIPSHEKNSAGGHIPPYVENNTATAIAAEEPHHRFLPCCKKFPFFLSPPVAHPRSLFALVVQGTRAICLITATTTASRPRLQRSARYERLQPAGGKC